MNDGRRPLHPARRLAELMLAAERTVALTGAGISVPSGIPDFRSPRTGLWQRVDPMEVAHIEVFRRDPERFWGVYGMRFDALRDKQPNRAHELLALLEQAGLLHAVITQNIDGLHTRAGTRELVEVHGTIAHSSCQRCGSSYALQEVRARQATDPRGVPRCDCAGPLKPDVVLFGEYLPMAALERAQRLAEEADLIVCVGSSLEVYPVAELPLRTLSAGGQLAIITRGVTPLDGRATVRLDGDVVDELEALARELDLASARPAPS
jgi:NAD-dependent deacetylase